MKVVETADGTIRVIELDPTKKHIIVMDSTAMPIEHIRHIKLVDGEILLKRHGTEITVIEGDPLPTDLRVR